MDGLLKAFARTKHLTSRDVQETPLHRRLSTLDLTTLGIGSTLGAGVYVVTGAVAKEIAGPAIVLSFFIAAVASILSGLCYAEFGARVPKAGSAYVYSYVTIGELCGFVIGWNLVLEYVVGASSVAKAWSGFFDTFFHNRVHDFIVANVGHIKISGLSDYPDFLAFSFIILVTIVLASGVKQSSIVNWFFTSINISVILFVTIAGLVFADTKNWGSFTPYGFSGVMSGAATCFFSFVGFDVVATSAEEARTPGKSIPRAIVGCLLICFLAYFGVSAALTLMVPYHTLDEKTGLATAFESRGFPVGKYVVAVGAIMGLSSSALGSLFPMPRILYAMASDGIIFRFFAHVNERTGIPLIACIFSGVLTAMLALLIDLISLVEMMSIGTLLAYTIVSLCVLVLRYRPCSSIITTLDDGTEINIINHSDGENDRSREDNKTTSADKNLEHPCQETGRALTDNGEEANETCDKESKGLLNHDKRRSSTKTPTWLPTMSQRLLGGNLNAPTEESYQLVKISLVLFVVFSVALQSCLIWGSDGLSKNPLLIILFVFLLFSLLIVVELIGRQPQSKNELVFKAPLVPLMPLLGIFINIFLILQLSYKTWIRFVVWMTIGMAIYLFYGIKHSTENKQFGETDHTGYVELNKSAEDSDEGK